MKTPIINNITPALPNDQNSNLKSSEMPPEEQSSGFQMYPVTTGERPSQLVPQATKPLEHLPQLTADYRNALATNIHIILPLVLDPTLRSTFFSKRSYVAIQ